MKIKLLPQVFFGKLSVVLGFSIPMLSFLGFYLDSVVPMYLSPLVIFAWIVSGVVALFQRDWSIVTMVSTIVAVIVFFVILAQPWISDAVQFFFAR